MYRHQPNAIVAFLLTDFLAYNLFRPFLLLNLKPQHRHGKTDFWARRMAADLYTVVRRAQHRFFTLTPRHS